MFMSEFFFIYSIQSRRKCAGSLIIGFSDATSSTGKDEKDGYSSSPVKHTQLKRNDSTIYSSSDVGEISETYMYFYDKPIDDPFHDFLLDDCEMEAVTKKGSYVDL